MAIIGNRRSTKADLFVKSAATDLQDPTFLTFELDFFPVPEEYPRYDGLMNSSLLPSDQSWFSAYSNNVATPDTAGYFTGSNGNGFPQIEDDQYRKVEFSAYEWLLSYYGANYGKMLNQKTPHPAQALIKMAKELSVIQDAPWYFQSIGGVNDLWKMAHRVGQGDINTTLTVNCLESIRRPLTTIAENYRWAVYDQERLSYRLPENLRWFDMTVSLVEGRYLVDHVGPFPFLQFGQSNNVKLFEYNSDNKLTRGLKVTTFKCKMCEFDFSDFLSGGGAQTDYTAYIQENKPFYPSFKINVGWVIHEEVDFEDAELMRQNGIFTGALNAINNRLTRILSSAKNLPNAIAGSVLNQVQTTIDKAALGNVYNPNSLNGLAGAISQFGAAATGRIPPVGPGSASLVNDRVYTDEPIRTVGPNGLGDAYPEPGRPPQVGRDDIGDAYPEPVRSAPIPGGSTGTDIYPEPDPQVNISDGDLGDVYPDEPPAIAGDLGDVYPEPDQPNPVSDGDLGDVYPAPAQPNPVSDGDLGDIYTDEPPTIAGDLGDVYPAPDQPNPVSDGDLGDIYPAPAQPNPVSDGDLGDVYP